MGTYDAHNSGNKAEVQKRTFGTAATHVQRNLAYSMLDSDDVSYFKSILGDNGVVQDEDRVAVANVDWMGKYKGASQLLLLPKSTTEVRRQQRNINLMNIRWLQCHCYTILSLR
jgi:D-2-hydroxyglutarate dehydrogenase